MKKVLAVFIIAVICAMIVNLSLPLHLARLVTIPTAWLIIIVGMLLIKPR